MSQAGLGIVWSLRKQMKSIPVQSRASSFKALLINYTGRILPQSRHRALYIKNQDFPSIFFWVFELNFVSFLTYYKSMTINYHNIAILEDACVKHKYGKNTAGKRETDNGV